MNTQKILDLTVENPNGHYSLSNYQMNSSIGYLLKRCYGFLTSVIDKQLAPYDLTHPQFAFLMTLKQQNCSTAAELARQSNLDTGATTRMLDRLEAKGIIERKRSLEDRRVITIVLTEHGKLVVEKMPIIAINVLNQHLKNFDEDEISTLKTLLSKLIFEAETIAATENDSNDEGEK
ncbi:Multiple antibiotic resistance protein MarR [Zhongshania aliphaticivorans]|uniref:Multiple antibiotic resistance protein MarR n=1 Tax=Zhongshania aliphaticivorans TaxID=1470434 RepID=A0A5S9MUK6_9GAMM|nr:MarR family transcriptional regulator [Zhongshania aliphaticivorans]CAA0080365.1 Multiple antibiotic resistance protein MarR [Zhongshania aliphaticivorans]CAA0085713.1 Multiple antibiotic resistance protein MarR [Zhongshania aliphaticivorans]